MRAAYDKDVAVLPPDSVLPIIRSGGFERPTHVLSSCTASCMVLQTPIGQRRLTIHASRSGFALGLTQPYASLKQEGCSVASTTTPDQELAYPSLITALCERDAYTRGHCDRVCTLALEMGHAAALSASSLEALRIASQLHDVGKIGVRDDVLLKPGKLTPGEWEEMKAHSVFGERIVKDTFLSNGIEVASIVRHHHEAFDGSGYPDGLAGTRIPLSCRILLVIDAYDAMTTGRAYHKPRSHGETMDILDHEVGTKLDPDIFLLFSEIIETSSARAS